MDKLKTAERWLTVMERRMLTGLILLMVALSFAQVVLRAFFSLGLLWSDTFLRHLVLFVGFLGAALATSEEKHFAMDAAARLFEGRRKDAVRTLSHCATLAVLLLLTRASVRFFLDEYRSGAVLFELNRFQVPGWIFEFALPAGFALLTLHSLIKIAESLCPSSSPPRF